MRKVLVSKRTGQMHVEEQNYWDSVWNRDTADISLKRIRKEEYFGELERLLSHYKPQKILEAGCGRGQWIKGIGELGINVDGTDFSSIALQIAKESCKNPHLFQCDLRNIPVKSNYYDFILSLGVIEHFEEGPKGVLKEHARILRNGGIFFCHVPLLNLNRRINPLWRTYEFLRQNSLIRRLFGLRPQIFFEYMMTKAEMTELFQECGFKILEYRPIYVGGGFEYDIPFFLKVGVVKWVINCLKKAIDDTTFFGPIFAHHHLIIGKKL